MPIITNERPHKVRSCRKRKREGMGIIIVRKTKARREKGEGRRLEVISTAMTLKLGDGGGRRTTGGVRRKERTKMAKEERKKKDETNMSRERFNINRKGH